MAWINHAADYGLTAGPALFHDASMDELYNQFFFDDYAAVNSALLAEYLGRLQAGTVRKTHLFDGRYENIYIDREDLASMSKLIPFWIDTAATVLGRPSGELQCGFWFNDMRPGDITLPHSHNDDDELLSGVYYVKVPEHSGELVLYQGNTSYGIQPEEGKLVLFSSSTEHEVTRNDSQEMRLSIGMNLGRKR